MNDASLYTGNDGQFGNEKINEVTEQKLLDQDRQIKELSPQLESIVKMIDAEIASVMSIDRFITATNNTEDNVRAELQASALYKGYLDQLKTKFALALNEVQHGRG